MEEDITLALLPGQTRTVWSTIIHTLAASLRLVREMEKADGASDSGSREKVAREASGRSTSSVQRHVVGVAGLTTRNWIWLAVRASWIVVGLIQGPWLPGELDAQHIQDPSWTFAVEMVGIVAAGIVFVVGFQAGRGTSMAKWPRPSWIENPFGLDRPVSLFEASSYYVVAVGVSSAVFELRAVPRTWAWELPVAIGVGLWLGAKVCLAAFRGRFADQHTPDLGR